LESVYFLWSLLSSADAVSTLIVTINHLLIGTYTHADEGGEAAQGIYSSDFDHESGNLGPTTLVAEAASPAFIAQNGNYIYTVNEQEEGKLSSFLITKGGLKFLNQVPSHGSYPCHLSVTSRYLSVANYGSGSIAIFDIRNGLIGSCNQQRKFEGRGPNQERQMEPHSHQVFSAEPHIYVPDLGSDTLYRCELSSEGELQDFSLRAELPPGSGPRHVDLHPTLPIIYLINELSSTIAVIDKRSMEILQLVNALPEDAKTASTTAEIAVSADGTSVYGSNRGDDSIVTFAVDQMGLLSNPSFTTSGGACPRHFTLDPSGQWLLVANQDTNNIVVFRLKNDRPAEIVCERVLPKPVCLHFLA